MEFEFDTEKARSNLRKHGMSFAHPEQVLRDEMAVTAEDPDSVDKQRFVTLKVDAIGRLLVVIHTQRGARTRLISAQGKPAQIGPISCVTNITSAHASQALSSPLRVRLASHHARR